VVEVRSKRATYFKVGRELRGRINDGEKERAQ